MAVCIKIEHCNMCPHVSHSGAFTPGGAKPICSHHGAAYDRPGVKPENWWQRQLTKDKSGNLIIPDWCPLS